MIIGLVFIYWGFQQCLPRMALWYQGSPFKKRLWFRQGFNQISIFVSTPGGLHHGTPLRTPGSVKISMFQNLVGWFLLNGKDLKWPIVWLHVVTVSFDLRIYVYIYIYVCVCVGANIFEGSWVCEASAKCVLMCLALCAYLHKNIIACPKEMSRSSVFLRAVDVSMFPSFPWVPCVSWSPWSKLPQPIFPAKGTQGLCKVLWDWPD